MLSSLNKLSSNLSKGQFRETRKYLDSFYVQQLNQPQINNATEGEKEGEVLHETWQQFLKVHIILIATTCCDKMSLVIFSLASE